MGAAAAIRTLRAGEEEQLLELLDGWPFRDGRRGRSIFGRYLEHDPTYTADNVHVAESERRLVACVQVFPRRLRVHGDEVPCGGIGSVFTKEAARGRGIASALLEAAVAAMVERGFLLSLLTSGRLAFYRRFGWHAWSGVEPRLYPSPTALAPPAGITCAAAPAGFDPAELREVGDAYARSLEGVVVRDAALWRASGQLAGNPDEQVWLAHAEDRIVAFARSTVFGRNTVIIDWGAAAGHVEALAALLAGVAAAAGGSASLSPVRDPALELALLARGRRTEENGAVSWMLQCLDPPALARRFGLAGRGLDGEELLERVLPRAEFSFFVADRF